MVRKYLILLGVIFTLCGPVAQAQVQNTDLVLSISPQYPNPNQNVTATLTSFATNLDKAHISWNVDGGERLAGIGKKVFYFTMGAIGSSINLSATINTLDGQSLQKNILITPTDVDILWQANDSYTPPFYKGKALPPSQGEFKVVAIPSLYSQSGKINLNNLSYSWSKDGNAQPDSSGWGRNSFIFSNSYLDKNNTVSLKVSDIIGTANASGVINLQTVIPKIVFYKSDPALGTIWENSIKNGHLINPAGETIVAEPFFFSPKNISSLDLSFRWSLNGQETGEQIPKNILSVKPEEGQSGSSIIKLMVENTKTLFQNSEKSISVEF